MTSPTFSILIPAKGRPDLVSDALLSVLWQSHADFEVIVSNNGGDTRVRKALQPHLSDSRVRYTEQSEVLPMPEHWERISLLATGRYQIVVPDRSLLRKDALSSILAIHLKGGSAADIVSWSWDLFHSTSNMLEPAGVKATEAVVLMSEKVALDSLTNKAPYPLALPRGLNSSVRTDLIAEIRTSFGRAFAPLTPDFSFAYTCLLMRPQFTHMPRPMCVSQGLSVSNGGIAYVTDAGNYLETLGLEKPICHSPIAAPFVENVIAEDFFAACARFGRPDLIAQLDRTALYLKCNEELEVKRAARILTPSAVRELENALDQGLAGESLFVRKSVHEARTKRDLTRIAKNVMRRTLGAQIELIRPYLLRLRGGQRFSSALEAAGHGKL